MEEIIIPEVDVPKDGEGLCKIFVTLMSDAMKLPKEDVKKLLNI